MDLRLSEREFWHMTLRRFLLLVRRHAEIRRHEDYRYGVIASLIAEVNRNPKVRTEPFTPAFWFPSLEETTRDRSAAHEQVAAVGEMRKKMIAYTYSAGGSVQATSLESLLGLPLESPA